jgi:hypothetical protein
MRLSARGDLPITTLRFYTVVEEEGLFEAVRISTSTRHLKAIIDVLCRSFDYYPERPAKVGQARKPRSPR